VEAGLRRVLRLVVALLLVHGVRIGRGRSRRLRVRGRPGRAAEDDPHAAGEPEPAASNPSSAARSASITPSWKSVPGSSVDARADPPSTVRRTASPRGMRPPSRLRATRDHRPCRGGEGLGLRWRSAGMDGRRSSAVTAMPAAAADSGLHRSGLAPRPPPRRASPSFLRKCQRGVASARPLKPARGGRLDAGADPHASSSGCASALIDLESRNAAALWSIFRGKAVGHAWISRHAHRPRV